MKILYFTYKSAPYRVEFFNQLNESNDVTIIFDYINNDQRNPKWYKNNVYNFKYINLKKNAYKQLKQILKDHYDVIVIGNYATKNAALFNLMLKRRKLDFYINADGGFVATKESYVSKFLKKFFISKATYWLSSGVETSKYLEYYGAKKDNISLYPLASVKADEILKKAISKSKKNIIREKYGYNYDRVYVSVGSFIYRKGYDYFLNNIDKVKDNECFIIIGGGKLKTEYERIINNRDLKNVFLVDFLEKDEVYDYYKMADMFFFPSREDIWGLVINEAISFALPVISNKKVLASTELIDDKYIFDIDKENDMLEKLNTIRNMSDSELVELGISNLEKAKSYSIEESCRVHLEIFKRNIGE